ncbi:hypothetical protein MAR_017777 [Mya arenaria]|uniref:Uncharacterized protein n=1 Tax=Mya arenaria TaxID=6604 RepID=A0ABY7EHF1_MYAAR|nr:hypothetical protein MAR_017777 [Mya arenaria]
MVKKRYDHIKRTILPQAKKPQMCTRCGYQGCMADNNALQSERYLMVTGRDANRWRRIVRGHAGQVLYNDNDEVWERSFSGVMTGQDDEQWTIYLKMRKERINFKI